MEYSRRRDTSGEDLKTTGPPLTGFASHVETVLMKDPDPSLEKHAVAVAIISREGNVKVMFVWDSDRWQTGKQVTAEQHMFYHEDGICEISGIVDGIPSIGWSRHTHAQIRQNTTHSSLSTTTNMTTDLRLHETL
ncbi:unnamed protein product [Clonostachys rhizophaga]|uniref:Uncharacterized protein n=1 Tax=Clonostachys rhizophaga TaxID=160324 RepID=A0A9N9VTB0_9HYPO|nr:unnamed protein product [Clonostachys rhizophaga]